MTEPMAKMIVSVSMILASCLLLIFCCHTLFLFPLRGTVGPLLAVLGFLLSRSGAVCAGDILLFLGFGFHLVVVFGSAFGSTLEDNAVLNDFVDV